MVGMKAYVSRPFGFLAFVSIVVSSSASAAPVDYLRDVKPLLKNKCYACHGPRKAESGLRLDAGKLAWAGGDNGAVIVPGDSSKSPLIARVSSTDDDERMPPVGAPLSADQVQLLRTWIDRGAAFPADEVVAPKAAEHWAFQPIRRVAVPEAKDDTWPLNAIDHFVLAKLRQCGWRPNEPAKPHALLRRTYLDVIGLPPTIAEQDAFLASPTRAAYDRLVDELLQRKGYGERYARHWLDVVRYADSNGYERDAAKPEVWRYRDYVIRALNDDKPFDQFIIEQLAGDEVPNADADSVIATGFNRLGPWDDEPADFDVDRYDQLDDLVNTTSQAFLALTMGCARCHDHKFDPLSQRDYYSMVAVFNPLNRPQNGRTELTRFAAPPAETRELQRREKGGEQLPDVPRGYFLYEPSPVPPATHILLRGSPASPGDEVGPAVPAILVKQQPEFLPPDQFTTRRRLSLARWIASNENPLTARVIVNRVWQWHFGEGLVRTSNDFGLLGQPPTHPELLDHLAYWFVHDAGWSLKKLHRYIMTSRTYQMSRQRRDDYAAVDPENRLLWRRSYHRLEVEAIRDSMLFVSGRLDRKMYGPPMHPFIPREALMSHADKTSIWPAFDEAAASRRTVYAFVKRSLLVPMLEVLDLCDTTRTSPKRDVTTVPTQALTLYNGDFVNRQARHLAERLKREAGDDPDARIQLAWRLAFCRPATLSEVSAMREFVVAQAGAGAWGRAQRAPSKHPPGGASLVPRDSTPATPAAPDAILHDRALVQLCRVIFNLNEFVYPD
jgi:mono/diheme cytochrome c family protein